jgi:hypothetical protein
MNVSDFRNKEIAFFSSPTFDKKRILFPFRGYTLKYSEYLPTLKKMLKISTKQYNTYVTIATYTEIPRYQLNRKKHWENFREWVKIRDQTIKRIDFMLDFDATPTIKGIKTAWQDVKKSLPLLQLLVGKNSKYLTVWFSGNKGFHILGKCRIGTKWGNTGQEIINKQKEIALELSLICPTIDTTIYDTARLRKLLGSKVYSKNFGQTRVIPIQNENEFNELIQALETKNKKYFEKKQLIPLSNVDL